MDTRSPKDRVLVALKKGQSDRVLGLISQFPGHLLFLKIISILSWIQGTPKKNVTCVHDEARIYRGTHNVLDFRDDYRIYSDSLFKLWFHAAKTFFLPTYLTLLRPDTKIQRSICLSKVFCRH